MFSGFALFFPGFAFFSPASCRFSPLYLAFSYFPAAGLTAAMRSF
jgi:hypothetical protein